VNSSTKLHVSSLINGHGQFSPNKAIAPLLPLSKRNVSHVLLMAGSEFCALTKSSPDVILHRSLLQNEKVKTQMDLLTNPFVPHVFPDMSTFSAPSDFVVSDLAC
jgi:hypothetical protein